MFFVLLLMRICVMLIEIGRISSKSRTAFILGIGERNFRLRRSRRLWRGRVRCITVDGGRSSIY